MAVDSVDKKIWKIVIDSEVKSVSTAYSSWVGLFQWVMRVMNNCG